MSDQHTFASHGLAVRVLTTLSIPFLFLVLRSLLRWRKERSLVRSLARTFYIRVGTFLIND